VTREQRIALTSIVLVLLAYAVVFAMLR